MIYHTVRMWHPRGPLQTEVWAYWAIDKNAPPEIREHMRKNGMQAFGPGGVQEQDDMDNWRNASDAGKSFQARKYLSHIGMGVGHEELNPGLPGRSIPAFCGEINQRSMYKRWEEMMNANSWADIQIDPMTANFEGSAMIKG